MWTWLVQYLISLSLYGFSVKQLQSSYEPTFSSDLFMSVELVWNRFSKSSAVFSPWVNVAMVIFDFELIVQPCLTDNDGGQIRGAVVRAWGSHPGVQHQRPTTNPEDHPLILSHEGGTQHQRRRYWPSPPPSSSASWPLCDNRGAK